MWRFWLPCPIRVLCWLAHLLLTQIVKCNHCFGNAAPDTSQAQAAVVRVATPHQASLADLCSPTRVMVIGGIFLAWWAWHVLFKYHLRPASSHRTAIYTVLRRLWLLTKGPWATSQKNHPIEDTIYHRGLPKVSGSPFKEKDLAFTLLPPKYVSHRIVEESLTHQQIVFWSEWVSPLMLSAESVDCGLNSRFWQQSPLFLLLTPVSEV